MKTLPASRRLLLFLAGMLASGFGVALSTLPQLGTSPISSLPRVLSLIYPLSFGQWTILSNLLFIGAQFAILRRQFPWTQLSQIPAVFLFGLFIDLGMWLFAPCLTDSYLMRMMMQVIGCATLAFGIFLLLQANLTYMPGDGLVRVIAQYWRLNFGTVKICFDCAIVLSALLLSLVAFHAIREVREGTLVAALLVGSLIKCYNWLLARICRT